MAHRQKTAGVGLLNPPVSEMLHLRYLCYLRSWQANVSRRVSYLFLNRAEGRAAHLCFCAREKAVLFQPTGKQSATGVPLWLYCYLFFVVFVRWIAVVFLFLNHSYFAGRHLTTVSSDQ